MVVAWELAGGSLGLGLASFYRKRRLEGGVEWSGSRESLSNRFWMVRPRAEDWGLRI